MMFLLHCPKCGHDMKYMSASVDLSGKRKKCVYCGKSFGVKDNIKRRL